MRNLIVVLLFISLIVPTDALPPRIVVTPAEPAPEPAPAKPRTSFLQRLFPKPTPAPTPAATPTPAPAPASKRRPRKSAARTEAETPTPPDTQAATPPKASTKASTAKGTKKPTTKVDLADLDDAAKFRVIKAKAMEDAEVKELKSKADSEIDEAEDRKAVEAYNSVLFRKIRALEPSLDGYVDKVEESMKKRLSSEKGKQ